MAGSPRQSREELALIYDGQCPVCTSYASAVFVEGHRNIMVRRIDARGDDELVRRARAAGLDLDEGMVVLHAGTFNQGADALHLLAQLAPRRGIKNRLNRLLFGSRTIAGLSYPVLRAARNALLRLLGRGKIAADEA